MLASRLNFITTSKNASGSADSFRQEEHEGNAFYF